VVFTDVSTGTITNRTWNFGNGVTTNTMATSFTLAYGTVGTNTVSLTVSGPLGTNKFTRTNYIVVTNAISVLVSNSFALTSESCSNSAIDAGEAVTMQFGLVNAGTANTTNLVATLLASGGITSPSAAQNYGAIIGGGAAVLRSFTFVPTGSCGTSNTATLQLQDGPNNLGTVSFSFVLGKLSGYVTQNFDTVTAPALPAGWTTSASGAATSWASVVDEFDTSPNSVFAPSVGNPGVAELVSPVIAMPSGGAQLTFRHRYSLEYGFDGAVLDLKIGSGSFTNVASTGATFITNGYNANLSTNASFMNPLVGQAAWTGDSGGFITTVLNLPASVSGQNIQLRWRVGSDLDFSELGWYVDSVTITTYGCCANPPVITSQPQNQSVLVGDMASFNVAASGTAPLGYQWRLYGTNLPGATGTNLTRLNVQPVDVGPYTVVVTNAINSVTSAPANLRIVIRPTLVSPQFSNGTFKFTLNGNSGYNYLVEGSTNLSSWTPVTTISNQSGQVQFVDPSSSNLLYRFYRARLIP
jgi:PKD repeat protein